MIIYFFCGVKNSIHIRPGQVSDLQDVHDLIRELARYERAEKEVEITQDQLAEDAFGENPIVEIWVAEMEREVVGAALIYEKYSTWKGRSVHLEDLIVAEEHRGQGIGKMLFEKIIGLAKERNYARMEWQVLDWNKPAIEFYQSYGAEFLNEWLDCRLSKNELDKF